MLDRHEVTGSNPVQPTLDNKSITKKEKEHSQNTLNLIGEIGNLPKNQTVYFHSFISNHQQLAVWC